MHRFFRTLLVFRPLQAFAVLLLVAVPALASDSYTRIVRLSYTYGDVQIDRGDGRGFDKAYLNMPVIHDAKLTTRADGQAEVEFEDGSTLRLVPDTSVTFNQLSLTDSGRRNSSVTLNYGTVYFERSKHAKDVFELVSNQHRLSISKPVHLRLTLGQADMALAVFSGEVAVQTNGPKDLIVKKGETLDLNPEAPVETLQVARRIDGAAYDEWDLSRAQYREQYLANNDFSNQYVSGVGDLNYYGNYYEVAGYGRVWRPYFAGVSWNPYGIGDWIYYPGYGYVFVSGAPWGWAPYHYGEWVFVGGTGWCWRPGRWHNWNPVAPVVNAPPGFVLPRPPVNSGPGVPRFPVVVHQGPERFGPNRPREGEAGGDARRGNRGADPNGPAIPVQSGAPASNSMPPVKGTAMLPGVGQGQDVQRYKGNSAGTSVTIGEEARPQRDRHGDAVEERQSDWKSRRGEQPAPPVAVVPAPGPSRVETFHPAAPATPYAPPAAARPIMPATPARVQTPAAAAPPRMSPAPQPTFRPAPPPAAPAPSYHPAPAAPPPASHPAPAAGAAPAMHSGKPN